MLKPQPRGPLHLQHLRTMKAAFSAPQLEERTSRSSVSSFRGSFSYFRGKGNFAARLVNRLRGIYRNVHQMEQNPSKRYLLI